MLPRPNELKLAEQLVASIEADFDPGLWQKTSIGNGLLKLIEAKARGEKLSGAH